jgi:hypothetical protein
MTNCLFFLGGMIFGAVCLAVWQLISTPDSNDRWH